jgi:hypothetical protein
MGKANALARVAKKVSGLLDDAAPAKRASKAENEAAGLYHPIGGGLKLDRPVSEMSATVEQIRNLPQRRVLSPEQMQGGNILALIGDRTAAGRNLMAVNGQPLARPVELQGGPDFMRTHQGDSAAWASGQPVITKLSKAVQEAGGKGDPVYGAYTAMSHTAGDFSTMMADALLEQLRNRDIKKKDIRAFDKEVRALRPEFPGLMDEDARAALDANGALRLAFVNRMGLDKYRQAGFPDVASTRAAITEPDLMDAPLWSSGFSVAKMDPTGRVIPDPRTPHKTYDTQLGGVYQGGLEAPVPRELMYPEFFAKRRAEGRDPAGDNRAFMLAPVVQPANQQWLDGVMGYIEKAKRGLLD